MLEKRQQRIRSLKSKHESLQVELEEAKRRLMLHPSRWNDECKYSQSSSPSPGSVYVCGPTQRTAHGSLTSESVCGDKHVLVVVLFTRLGSTNWDNTRT